MLAIERLKTIPLFAELDDEELARLAPHFHHRRCKIGHILTRQGDPGDAFFVLDEGALRVRYVDAKDMEQVLGYLSAPAFFGETSLLTGQYRDVTIDVFSDEAALRVLTRAEFEAVLREHPHIRAHLKVRSDVQDLLARRRYPWLSDDEVVLVETRRHWYALAERLVPRVAIALLLALAGWIAGVFDPTHSGWLTLVSRGLMIGGGVYLVGTVIWNTLDWSNDYFIVTNKRIIHIEKVIFFVDSRSEVLIEQVTNVKERRQGVAAFLWGFTHVGVETSGRKMDLDLTFAPRSQHIREQIFDQFNRIRDRVALEKRERVRTGIRNDLWNRLAPADWADGKAPAVSTEIAPSAPATPARRQSFRRVRQSGLARRLTEWFGLEVEGPHQVTWRKHWFVLLARIGEPAFAVVLLVTLACVHLTGIVPIRVLGTGILSWQGKLGLAAIWTVLLMLAVGWIWYRYVDWSNDIYRVTDDRLLDLERKPFWMDSRSVETTLDRVQDISYERRGILANAFNFGDLVIQTGGTGSLRFMDIKNPRGASQEIFRRRDAHRATRQNDEVRQDRREFLDWFMEYHRFLREQGEIASPRAHSTLVADGSPRLGADAPLALPAGSAAGLHWLPDGSEAAPVPEDVAPAIAPDIDATDAPDTPASAGLHWLPDGSEAAPVPEDVAPAIAPGIDATDAPDTPASAGLRWLPDGSEAAPVPEDVAPAIAPGIGATDAPDTPASAGLHWLPDGSIAVPAQEDIAGGTAPAHGLAGALDTPDASPASTAHDSPDLAPMRPQVKSRQPAPKSDALAAPDADLPAPPSA